MTYGLQTCPKTVLPHTGFLARFIHKSDAREGKQCLSAIIGGKKLGNKGFTLIYLQHNPVADT
jgi:hypothetical protein